MTEDPWTDPDPQPGAFDADLAVIDPSCVEAHEGDPDAKLTVVLEIAGEDALRLQRLASERGQGPAEVIAALLRDA